MMKLKYCSKCGKEVSEEAKFCPNCGTSIKQGRFDEFEVSSEDLVGKVKNLIHEGNVRRIVVKNEAGESLLEIPVTVGVIGFLLAPYLAALGVIAALVTKSTIVVERRE
ncbi:DUF4342 domain-containing protein [Candidatus Bathyarchaeota archaeon]|nr:DUF4342 domain-containing protein [Candidatus Bathyarchaeota archaeon]